MGSVVLTVLSVALGLFFVLAGSIKLSPIISQDLHQEMTKGFVKYAKVFPLQKQTGYQPPADLYRKAVGITEVVCGLVLAFIPGGLKLLSNLILLVIMFGAGYTHYTVKDPLEKSAGAIVFTVLLLLRLILSSRQSKGRASPERETPSSGKPRQKKAQ